MEVWDTDAINLVGPACIEFDRNDQGSFQLIAVEGWMDVRPADHGEPHAVELSWVGRDEFDPASERGWAVVGEDGALTVASSCTSATTPNSVPFEVDAARCGERPTQVNLTSGPGPGSQASQRFTRA